MFDSVPERISAEMLSTDSTNIINSNNVLINIKYDNGSIASIIYSTIGNESFSKERIEIFYDTKIITIDDFKELNVIGLKKKKEKSNHVEKGHYELLKKYGEFLLGKNDDEDIPTVEDGIKATLISLKVIESLKTGKSQKWSFNIK